MDQDRCVHRVNNNSLYSVQSMYWMSSAIKCSLESCAIDIIEQFRTYRSNRVRFPDAQFKYRTESAID